MPLPLPVPAPPAAPPPIEILYVGGPTAVVEIAGLRLLTDPTLDPPGEFRSGSVRLEKTEGPALPPEGLGRIDLVLLSHDQHPDNLDAAGRALVARTPTLTTRAGAERLGAPAVGLDPWQSHDVVAPSGVTLRITATPARHGPAGVEPLLGAVVGFVVSTVAPARDLLWVTGDTVWFDGTREVARRFDPEAILLFAGAARTRGAFHLTMDSNDAVEAAVAFPRAVIVPVHHAGWAHFTESQSDLERTFSTLGLAARLLPATPAGTLVIHRTGDR